MKKNFTVVFILVIALSLFSCCTKMECAGVHNIFQIEFAGFTADDLNSITIYSYASGTGFSTPLDSMHLQGQPAGDRVLASLTEKILIERDYKILLPRTGQTFTLNEFETETTGCNRCFPYTPKGDMYVRLTAYKVNGVRQLNSLIEISN